MYQVFLKTLLLFGLLEYLGTALELHSPPVFHHRAVGMTCACVNDYIPTVNVTYNITRRLYGIVRIQMYTEAVRRMPPKSIFVIRLSNNYFSSPMNIVCTAGDYGYVETESLYQTEIYDPERAEEYQLHCSIPNNRIEKYANRTVVFEFPILSDNLIHSGQLTMSLPKKNILLMITENDGLPLIYYEYEVSQSVIMNCFTSATGYYLTLNGSEDVLERDFQLSASDNNSLVKCSLCAIHCEWSLIEEIRVLFRARQTADHSIVNIDDMTLIVVCSVATLVLIPALVCVILCVKTRNNNQGEYSNFSTQMSTEHDKDTPPIYAVNTSHEVWAANSTETPVTPSEVENRPPSPIYDYAYCRVQVAAARVKYTNLQHQHQRPQNTPHQLNYLNTTSHNELSILNEHNQHNARNKPYYNGVRLSSRSSHQYTEIDENFLNEQKARCKKK